jgi:pectate lyase
MLIENTGGGAQNFRIPKETVTVGNSQKYVVPTGTYSFASFFANTNSNTPALITINGVTFKLANTDSKDLLLTEGTEIKLDQNATMVGVLYEI